MKEVKSCVNNTTKYFEANRKRFENKGIYEYFEKETKELQWLAMIEILCENGYALECNWVEKKKAFVSKLNGLKRVRIMGICVEPQWLDEEEIVENWVKVINDKWIVQGMGICSISIENKIYLLGPYKVDKNTQAALIDQLEAKMDMANSYSMDEVMEYADSLTLYQNGQEKEYKKEALDAKTVAELIDETLNEVGNKLVLNFVFQGEGQYIKRLEQYVYQPWKGTMVIFHEKEGMALFYICRKEMDCYRLIHKCKPSLEVDIPVGNTELCSCVVHENRKKLDKGIQQIFKNIKNVNEALSDTEEWCQEYPAGKKAFDKLCEKYGISTE